jgi:hypothetical protein
MLAKRFMVSVVGLCVPVLFAASSWAANLNFSETSSGVVVTGDGNFTTDDWLALVSLTTGPESATVVATINNPNGPGGTELIGILDPDGSLSDTLSLSMGGGGVTTLTAVFCSGANCAPAGTAFDRTLTEDASGNWSGGTPLDGNLSINGLSPEVPEPASLLLLGSGLVGLVVATRRRHKK